MTLAIFILQIITIALALGWWYVWQRHLFAIDTKRMADSIAGQLLEDFEQDLYLLDEKGTKEFTRTKYGHLCFLWGLPLSASDYLETAVWQRIQIVTHGELPQTARKGFAFYE